MNLENVNHLFGHIEMEFSKTDSHGVNTYRHEAYGFGTIGVQVSFTVGTGSKVKARVCLEEIIRHHDLLELYVFNYRGRKIEIEV